LRKYTGATRISQIIMTSCDIEWSSVQALTATNIAVKPTFLFSNRPYILSPDDDILRKSIVHVNSRDNLILDESTSILSYHTLGV
jgi:hypothetical protein